MQCIHPANAISKSLTALREFVYNSTEDASPTVNIPISEMKKAIAMKRITIVGVNVVDSVICYDAPDDEGEAACRALGAELA